MRLILIVFFFGYQSTFADIHPPCCKCESVDTEYEILKLSETIKKNPQSAALRLERGINYKCLLQMDSAYFDFLKSAELDSTNAEVYYELAALYNMLVDLGVKEFSSFKKTDSAEYFVTKALSINPQYGEAYNLLGAIYTKDKKYAEAIKKFNKAAEFGVCCSGWAPYTNRCMIYLLTGNLDSAYIDYTQHFSSKALNSFDDYMPFYFSTHPEEAQELYNRLLKYKSKLFPKNHVVGRFGRLLDSFLENQPEKKKVLEAFYK